MKKYKLLSFWLGFLILLIFQLKTTNISAAYVYTPAQLDQQIQRMNYYPPRLARVAYILEAKKEVQLVKKLENNFFNVIDFGEYFPKYIPYLLSPFFFLGLFLFAKNREEYRVFFYSFLFSIFIMTIIGNNAKYGPILLLPFFYYFLFLGLMYPVRKK